MSAPAEKKQRPDYEVVADTSHGVPAAGTVTRIPGSKDQFHAFKVYGKSYVSSRFSAFPFIFHLF